MRNLPGRKWLFSSKGTISYWKAQLSPDDWLVFGSETHGLSDTIRSHFPETIIRIPQIAQERCLNLSTAVGIGLYEALRQLA